jgi:hypothetical protein
MTKKYTQDILSPATIMQMESFLSEHSGCHGGWCFDCRRFFGSCEPTRICYTWSLYRRSRVSGRTLEESYYISAHHPCHAHGYQRTVELVREFVDFVKKEGLIKEIKND